MFCISLDHCFLINCVDTRIDSTNRVQNKNSREISFRKTRYFEGGVAGETIVFHLLKLSSAYLTACERITHITMNIIVNCVSELKFLAKVSNFSLSERLHMHILLWFFFLPFIILADFNTTRLIIPQCLIQNEMYLGGWQQ